MPVLSVEPGQAVSLSLLPADNVDEPLGLRRVSNISKLLLFR